MSPRIFYAAVLCVLILGGAGVFLREKQPEAGLPAFHYTQASEQYSLELTPTFSLEKDPFALNTDDSPAMVVTLGGKELLALDSAAAGEPVLLEEVRGLVKGMNEFFITATPSGAAASAAQALRVRLLQGGQPVADESYWTSHGLPVKAVFRVALEGAEKEGAHGE